MAEGQEPQARDGGDAAVSLIGWPYPLTGTGNAFGAQAMTEQQLAAQQALAYQAMRPYQPTLADHLGMMNYRPPVHIPQGWQDWYAIGDQLH